MDSTMSQIDPTHNLFSINFNIIPPSKLTCPEWSLPIALKHCINFSPFSSVLLSRLHNIASFYHPNYIWLWIQIKKFLIMHLSTASCYFFLRPNILLSMAFPNTLDLCEIQVITAARTKPTVSWDIALWSLVNVDWRFKVNCFNHQGNESSSWWWRQEAPLKRPSTSMILQGAVSQKTVMFILNLFSFLKV
jgi:hypothetical protein